MWYKFSKFIIILACVSIIGFLVLAVKSHESLDPRGGWCIDHAFDKDGKKFSVPVICNSPLRPGR